MCHIRLPLVYTLTRSPSFPYTNKVPNKALEPRSTDQVNKKTLCFFFMKLELRNAVTVNIFFRLLNQWGLLGTYLFRILKDHHHNFNCFPWERVLTLPTNEHPVTFNYCFQSRVMMIKVTSSSDKYCYL